MISKRQEQILEYLIKEYTKLAEPIGSMYLLNKYHFNLSGATMRSELNNLEQNGFLYQPHTSSGRVPTDKGYRYYVNTLMKNRSLSVNEQKKLQEEHLKLKSRNVRLARSTAKLLSAFSRNLAISGLIEDEDYFQSGIKDLISQPEFKNIDEICKTVEILDFLDENIDSLLKKLNNKKIDTLIGSENPFAKEADCSIIITKSRLASGKNALIAILGPTRMQYAKNISLIKYVSKLLEKGDY